MSLRSQARAAAVLGTTLDLPGTAVLARRSGRPRADDTELAGVAATVVRPTAPPPWPAIVFANGATPDGRAHPTVLRLGHALARSGFLVFIPDLPGISAGELSPAALAAAVEFTRAAADGAETAHGRVGLTGVSLGASLALLAAADPRLDGRVSLVACVAPYTDLAKVMRLATTGLYESRTGPAPYPAPDYLRLALARSLTALLPSTPGLAALRAELGPDDVDPLVPLRASRDLSADEATVVALLANDEPARFDELYAALPQHVLTAIDALSPLRAAPRLRVPVEIVTAPRDRYFPVAESLALVRASPRVRLTVTSLLAHAEVRLSPRYAAELGRLNGFFVRVLAAAS